MSPMIKRGGFAMGIVACAGLAGIALLGNATADTLPPATRVAQAAPQPLSATPTAARKDMLVQ